MGNIILIGFMGVGKSEIGRMLASELTMNFLDTDLLIEKMEGKTVSEIFKEKGEGYFRDLEEGVVKALQDYDNFVISTGGGMVLRPSNVEGLKKLGPLILLTSEPDVIAERLKSVEDRPLLEVPDKEAEIRKILDVRNPIYHSVADFEIDTSRVTINEAVERIIGYVQSKSFS